MNMFFFTAFFWYIGWIFSVALITKNTNDSNTLFSVFQMSLISTGSFMTLKSRFFCKFFLKVCNYSLQDVSIWLNTIQNSKANVATNSNPCISDNKSISLFLITGSVSLSYSSGLKEYKMLTLWVLA